MNDALEAPADTRIMGIVHRALRRDLGRAREVLAFEDTLSPRQRAAVGDHLEWLMAFLHEHHEGEDRGLWPRVLAANPAAGPLLDQMDRDHHAIAPGISALEAAAASFRQGGPAAPVIEAIDLLEASLLPHLRREEDETMPVVAATLSQREWDEFDQEENIESRSPLRLGIVGHFLVDGLTPDEAELVTGLVPPVKRFVLLHGIGPIYRRQARRRWGARPSGFGIDRDQRFPLATQGTVSVEVAATPAQVWTLLADPTRVGEWSHEAVGAQWLDDADRGVPGAWFQGRSHVRIFGWRRHCMVTVTEPNCRFAWRTRGGIGHDCTEWSFTVEPTSTGTRITQTFIVLACSRWWARLISVVVPEHKEREIALADDLRRLGEVAASRSVVAA